MLLDKLKIFQEKLKTVSDKKNYFMIDWAVQDQKKFLSILTKQTINNLNPIIKNYEYSDELNIKDLQKVQANLLIFFDSLKALKAYKPDFAPGDLVEFISRLHHDTSTFIRETMREQNEKYIKLVEINDLEKTNEQLATQLTHLKKAHKKLENKQIDLQKKYITSVEKSISFQQKIATLEQKLYLLTQKDNALKNKNQVMINFCAMMTVQHGASEKQDENVRITATQNNASLFSSSQMSQLREQELIINANYFKK